MNTIFKAACLVIYLLALAGIAGLPPAGALSYFQAGAAVLLAIHALELLFVMRHVRLYQGALATSILLTLLFGLMHWKPLADRQAKAGSPNPGAAS